MDPYGLSTDALIVKLVGENQQIINTIRAGFRFRFRNKIGIKI